MYASSEEAMEDDDIIGLVAARAELRKHSCAILNTRGEEILVANECDPAEWIRCSPKAILEWLGY